MRDVFVIDAIRTPIGNYGGALSSVRPDDLLATLIRAIMERNPGVDPNAVEDVIAGAANQSGEDNRNVARMAALLAGLPVSVGGVTVNRLCASGMQSMMDAARAIMCGDGDIYIAGGVESMTRAPYVMEKQGNAWSRKPAVYDTTMGWRFVNEKLAAMYYPYSMGETAENIARQWKISRQEQDEFALASQEKYAAARDKGKFNDELTAVEIDNNGLITWVTVDEHPRNTSIEKLAALKPAFIKDGTVTAGNSSGINDGSSVLLLACDAAVKKYSLKPLVKIMAMATVGVDPAIMGIGPVPATEKVLKRAGLDLKDIALVELNEAFASQSIACIRELGLDPSLVNVNGGAIALGHPLGCSGARISTTLIREMKRQQIQYGLCTMCVGVGQGAAMIFQDIN